MPSGKFILSCIAGQERERRSFGNGSLVPGRWQATTKRAALSSAGAVLTEFALSMNLLLLMACGVFDFGLALHEHGLLINACRVGARAAAAYEQKADATPADPITIATSVTQAYLTAAGVPETKYSISAQIVEAPLISGKTARYVEVYVYLPKAKRFHFKPEFAFSSCVRSSFHLEEGLTSNIVSTPGAVPLCT